MKKRYVITLLLLVAIMLPVGLKCYDTYKRYTMSEEIYYGVGEPFIYNGVKYELKDMETYDFDGLIEQFGLQNSAEKLRELENLQLYQRKYFVATIELTATEEIHGDGILELKGGSKYLSGDINSLFIMQEINGTMSMPQLNVGETTEYYVVFSVTDTYYTDETFEALDEGDVYLRILDMSTGQAYCMQKK